MVIQANAAPAVQPFLTVGPGPGAVQQFPRGEGKLVAYYEGQGFTLS
jgi:hypothetical protein